LENQKIDSEKVGFWLAPRLNAAGRMGHAQLAVELLTRADEQRAKEILLYLEDQNRGRQSLERRIFKQACEKIDKHNLASDAHRAIVLASEQWHPGVIGIVASRVVERYNRPTILIALKEGEGQGSGRSIKHFALHQALADCAEHLISFGGHAMAAGLRIEEGRIEPFADAFVQRANQALTGKDLDPALHLDAEVSLSEMTEPVVRELHRLAPFGMGNPKPKFASAMLELDGEPRAVGKSGEHLQIQFTDGRTRRKAIAFRAREMLQPLIDHRRCRVAFEPVLNTYNGRTSVELSVIDFAFPD
jgi:single-stranded-DNA-specific exonuclease